MEGRAKAFTAVVGLLTAAVVLLGSLTDQGWLPPFMKRPVQAAIPGTQPNEHPRATRPGAGGDGETRERPKSKSGSPEASKNQEDDNGSSGVDYGAETCVEGYVCLLYTSPSPRD